MKKTVLLAGIAALAAAPLIAQNMPGHEGHGMNMEKAPMTRADIEARVKTHFAEMDANKDGTVTQAEIGAARAARMTKMHDTMFAKLDADKNGSISRAEFDAHHQRMMSGDTPSPNRMEGHHGMKMGMGHDGDRRGAMEGHLFGMADANKDGKVTQAEATTAALTHFDKMDTDKNGTISDAEHKAARDQMRANWKANKSD